MIERGDRRGIAERAKLSELSLAMEWRELRGDALAQQHVRDDVASTPAVGVHAAVDEDGDPMRISATGGSAALRYPLARPSGSSGRGRLCEDPSSALRPEARSPAGDARPGPPAVAEIGG